MCSENVFLNKGLCVFYFCLPEIYYIINFRVRKKFKKICNLRNISFTSKTVSFIFLFTMHITMLKMVGHLSEIIILLFIKF